MQSNGWKIGPFVVCVFFPFILDIKFVGRTSPGHTGERSQDFSSTFLFFLRCVRFFSSEEDSVIPFPRRSLSRMLRTTNDFINRSPLVGHLLFIIFIF